MNAGRFEQVGTPQELYYEPRSAFVAGFVGANNRVVGNATRVDGELVELASADGLAVGARASGEIAAGDRVEAFVRPEVVALARDASELPSSAQRYYGRVESLLFDGANSAVLVREVATRAEVRIALPQTGRFADLKAGETVAFGFDAQRAVCFPAGDHARDDAN
jgi:spermidine/putrescine transport system ATP-binding protein